MAGTTIQPESVEWITKKKKEGLRNLINRKRKKKDGERYISRHELEKMIDDKANKESVSTLKAIEMLIDEFCVKNNKK